MSKIIKLIKDFNELVMFKHTIFSLPFIFIAMIVGANGWFGFELLLLGVGATITARNFAMGFNRYLDIDIDAKNPRTISRPSVDGRLSPKMILIFTILNAIGFIVVAYFVNSLAFYLSIPILAVLGAYSYFKRFSHYAHLILGISLGLAPVAGVVAVSGEIPLWTIYLSIGVMYWVAGFDLLYSLQDMEVDKELELHSIPSQFGSKATLFISKIFHMQTVLFWLFFAVEISAGFFIYLALVLSAVMLFIEHRIVNRDFRKIDIAFFTINGYLGVMFLIFTILEYSF
jgi:4-hydroxybenzoate polyprenyltransferase